MELIDLAILLSSVQLVVEVLTVLPAVATLSVFSADEYAKWEAHKKEVKNKPSNKRR